MSRYVMAPPWHRTNAGYSIDASDLGLAVGEPPICIRVPENDLPVISWKAESDEAHDGEIAYWVYTDNWRSITYTIFND